MSDLVERLWSSDAASALTNEAARRISALENALQRADVLLTSHAAKTGSMHAWWDDIMDIRALLRKET